MAARRRRAALFLLALAPVLALVGAAPARAHGKELDIGVGCRAPSPSVPLERLCEATVLFALDREPVTDARLVLRAVRSGKPEPGIDGVELTAEDAPGKYAATFTLPAYGTWEITVDVLAPSEGQVQLDQLVLPTAGPAGAEDGARIRLVVGFDARDGANIVVLLLHLLGGSAILAANGAVLLGGLLTDERRTGYRRTVAHLFPRVVVGSIALLAATGAYSARYNAPTRAPGLFRPDGVSSLPYGDAYLATFAVKMVLAAALVVGTLLLARRLRHDPAWLERPVSDAVVTTAPLAKVDARRFDGPARLGAANLAAGGLALVAVVVVDYLHLLTHAGSFTGL